MKYTGEACQVCNEIFADSDNVVVCPECGTPVHRECWDKYGKCINEERHGEYTWSPMDSAPVPESNTEPDSTISKLCPFCSARNDENALTCIDCGRPLIEENETESFHNRYAQPDFQNPLNSNQTIDGVEVSKIAKFVQINHFTYINKFTKLSQKKLSFNWAAAFFNPQWFFYRKLYYWGGIFLGLQLLGLIVSSFLLSHFGLQGLIEQYMNAESMQATQEVLIQLQPHIWKLLLVLGINLLPSIVAGFIGDIVYKKAVFKKIKTIEESPDSNNLFTYSKNGGGVSFLAAGLSYLIYNLIYNLLISLL